MIGILFISLLVLMFVGVPIAIALGASSMVVLSYQGMPLVTVAQSVFESLDSFSLMAIPFFILAGNLMQSGGIAKRLVNLANAILGWIRGGLGGVVVLTSMFFSTMSGSSSATTAAVGSVLIPAMEKKGYPRPFGAAVAASSGELGAIIPPSIPMIVYALTANVSVASIFLAGILPGLLVGLSLIVCTCLIARLRNYDMIEPITLRQWTLGVLLALKQSFFAILMPMVILGGIYSGMFTPTEASVVAVVYGLVVGLFIYRELSWRDLLDVFGRSAVTSAIILIIVAFAAIFAYMLTINRVPHMLGTLITGISDNPLVFLLIVNVALFLIGMFLETLAAIIILAPILAPAAMQFGIDPVHFACIMVVNLAVGMVTPPVGVNLFVACQVANVRMEQLMRPLLLFLGVLIMDVMIITYVPALSTWFLP
ncbi:MULTISPECIES: TRAP transporter large permease [Phytopseudomonas]|uniref:TRAP transporter large permease protein n=1 Tax=Phytopseudomonas dryadis TaxID=2487520 RepID=A0ABY1Z6C9_9GAMM|nr:MULTISPECIES: TRAP transporter large permease [Pseudomonas]TBU78867.1 C4-dicarboxylate ABC transporter permease [Pseudomonas daroniae]TBV02260.1 C4-dicarboxylate ABC transporter permease [Pseudomonas dryadis]TBV15204.1 C4-dicarboxylate ABC transporter permease [Pseudomonas sp. FRB 230]